MGHVAAPTAVRFEHRTDEDPVLGIGTATPRLSWIVPAADAGFVQEAYEVELTRAGGAAEVVRVTSGEQVLVPWPVAPLRSRESVRIRLRDVQLLPVVGEQPTERVEVHGKSVWHST